uniref:Uncharacterized protein n=1 Tax=Ascaris lumbricoides TaxID=6252 RepID=A0A9J2PLF5_ASCLU
MALCSTPSFRKYISNNRIISGLFLFCFCHKFLKIFVVVFGDVGHPAVTISSAEWIAETCSQPMPKSGVNWAQLAKKWMQMREAERAPSDGSLPLSPSASTKVDDGGCMPPDGGGLAHFARSALLFSPLSADGTIFPETNPPPGWMPLPPDNLGSFMGPFSTFMSAFYPRTNEGYAMPMVLQLPLVMSIPPYSSRADEKKHIKEKDDEYSHYHEKWNEDQKAEMAGRLAEKEKKSGMPQHMTADSMSAQWNQSPISRSAVDSGYANTVHVLHVGQQTPKPLPAWLREGLKRAERDKQKKLLKKAKLHGTEEACKAQGATKGPEKLDSDDGDDDGGDGSADISFMQFGQLTFLKVEQGGADMRSDSGEHFQMDYRSEEERREDALALLRHFMTEALMVTTDAQLELICRVQFNIAMRKAGTAQPKVLVRSKALAALSALGAESDSEESGGEEAKRTMENGSEELSKRQFKQPEDEIGTANAVTLSRHNERESSRRSSPAVNRKRKTPGSDLNGKCSPPDASRDKDLEAKIESDPIIKGTRMRFSCSSLPIKARSRSFKRRQRSRPRSGSSSSSSLKSNSGESSDESGSYTTSSRTLARYHGGWKSGGESESHQRKSDRSSSRSLSHLRAHSSQRSAAQKRSRSNERHHSYGSRRAYRERV